MSMTIAEATEAMTELGRKFKAGIITEDHFSAEANELLNRMYRYGKHAQHRESLLANAQ